MAEREWHHYVGPQEYQMPLWMEDVVDFIQKHDPSWTFEDEVLTDGIGPMATHMEWQEPWCIYSAAGPGKNLSRLDDD